MNPKIIVSNLLLLQSIFLKTKQKALLVLSPITIVAQSVVVTAIVDAYLSYSTVRQILTLATTTW